MTSPQSSPAAQDPRAIARRVCITHELAQRADWVSMTPEGAFGTRDDYALSLADHAGRVATICLSNRDKDLRVALVRAGGTIQAWIERLDAEAAR